MDPDDLQLCLVQSQCLTMQSWIPSILLLDPKASTSKAADSSQDHLIQILIPQTLIQISTSERSRLGLADSASCTSLSISKYI